MIQYTRVRLLSHPRRPANQKHSTKTIEVILKNTEVSTAHALGVPPLMRSPRIPADVRNTVVAVIPATSEAALMIRRKELRRSTPRLNVPEMAGRCDVSLRRRPSPDELYLFACVLSNSLRDSVPYGDCFRLEFAAAYCTLDFSYLVLEF
jgi:hypothetical protein